MAVLPLITVPNPLLRQVSMPVQNISEEVLSLLDDMLETMYAEEGAGLAAIQVGVPSRLIVLDLRPHVEENQPMKLINPKIIWKSEEMVPFEEGCLSIPGQRAEVMRHKEIHFKYTDIYGKENIVKTEGYLAVGIQHEFDHLEGTLYTDYLSPLKGDMIIKKAQRYQKENR